MVRDLHLPVFHFSISCCSPVHILADIVVAILENKVRISAKPHTIKPIPLITRGSMTSHFNTTPFQAEFEVVAALWESRLFPIVSAALPALDDIFTYEIQLNTLRTRMLQSIHVCEGICD